MAYPKFPWGTASENMNDDKDGGSNISWNLLCAGHCPGCSGMSICSFNPPKNISKQLLLLFPGKSLIQRYPSIKVAPLGLEPRQPATHIHSEPSIEHISVPGAILGSGEVGPGGVWERVPAIGRREEGTLKQPEGRATGTG